MVCQWQKKVCYELPVWDNECSLAEDCRWSSVDYEEWSVSIIFSMIKVVLVQRMTTYEWEEFVKGRCGFIRSEIKVDAITLVGDTLKLWGT